MAVAIFTVLLIGFILGGSTVYLVENHLRTNEMNKIYKLTESLINGNELDGSDIGKETIYSKTVSYTHLTLPTTLHECRSRWSPYH